MVRPKILKFGKTTAVYGFGNIIQKMTAFFLIPLYTKYLSLSEVGSLALIELLESFLLLVLLSGLIQSVWKRIGLSDKNEKNKIIFSAWIGLLLSASIISTLLIMYPKSLESFLGLDYPAYEGLFQLVILGIFFQVNGQFLLHQLQFENKSLHYIIYSLIQLVLILGLSVYLTVFDDMGIHGIVYAKVIILAGSFVYSAFYILLNFFSLPSISIFKQLIMFGIPFILFGLATPILTLSDRFFLNMFVPLSLIGIYSINYKFGMMINMFVIIPIQRGLLPMIYKEGLRDEMKPIYKDILFYYLIIGCLFILGITFFIKPFIGFVSSTEYLEAAYVVPFVAAAYLIAGFRPFFTPLVALKDRTDLLGKAAIIGIAVCLSLNYILIKNYGIDGAVAATILSYVIFTFSVYYLSKRVEPMDWGWLRIGKVALLTGFILSGVQFAGNQWKDFEMVFGFIGLTSFPILLWAFRIIGEREINGVKSIISFVQNKVNKP